MWRFLKDYLDKYLLGVNLAVKHRYAFFKIFWNLCCICPAILPFKHISGRIKSHENYSLWIRDCLDLFEEHFTHFLTLIQWCVTDSQFEFSVLLFSDPDPQILNRAILHPQQQIHTSKLLLHTETTTTASSLPVSPEEFVSILYYTPAMWAVPLCLSYSNSVTVLWLHRELPFLLRVPQLDSRYMSRCPFTPLYHLWSLPYFHHSAPLAFDLCPLLPYLNVCQNVYFTWLLL